MLLSKGKSRGENSCGEVKERQSHALWGNPKGAKPRLAGSRDRVPALGERTT